MNDSLVIFYNTNVLKILKIRTFVKNTRNVFLRNYKVEFSNDKLIIENFFQFRSNSEDIFYIKNLQILKKLIDFDDENVKSLCYNYDII